MNLLFYTNFMREAGERLRGLIETLIPNRKIEIHRTIDSLACRLRQPGDNPSVMIIMAGSKEELSGILSLRDLLWDVRIILVLPDREEDTVARGHTLRPRLLTFVDSNFVEVAAVLEKMLDHVDSGLGAWRRLEYWGNGLEETEM
ncbi:MAG: hypothetical protein SV775_16210 [Thermodesulfobacteriota bacterium]|nr:hypothetical protein [Thermodesulfobacteriota bacterium]